jgi:hypothetical protein
MDLMYIQNVALSKLRIGKRGSQYRLPLNKFSNGD